MEGGTSTFKFWSFPRLLPTGTLIYFANKPVELHQILLFVVVSTFQLRQPRAKVCFLAMLYKLYRFINIATDELLFPFH